LIIDALLYIMLNVSIDTTRLNRAMLEFSRSARKEMHIIVRQQAGIIVGHLIAMTPPASGKGQNMSDRGGIDNSAKKAGEARLAADIVSLFPTTRLKESTVRRMVDAGFEFGTGRGKKTVRDFAETEADLARIHKASRSPSTGRVRTGRTGQNMAVTRSQVRRAYIKTAQKKVGVLNAGWLAAAHDLKTSSRATPAWITRHGKKPGGINQVKTVGGILVQVFNSVPYFPKDMERRVQRAIFYREKGLKKATEAMLARRAAKANATMES
jgi:hypothetical protein